MDTRLPPSAVNPQSPLRLTVEQLINHITLSACSLVSSSIFLRNKAPLTVSNLWEQVMLALKHRGSTQPSPWDFCLSDNAGLWGNTSLPSVGQDIRPNPI